MGRSVGPEARDGWAVSAGRRVEASPALEPDLIGRPRTALLLVRGYVAGTGFEPVKAMPAILQVAAPSPAASRPIPACSRSPLVTCTNDLPTASAVTRRPSPYGPDPRGPASGRGKSEGNPGCHLTREFHAYLLPAFVSPTDVATVGRLARTQDRKPAKHCAPRQGEDRS
jgi:hypothetical protein